MAQKDIRINAPQRGLNRSNYNIGESEYTTLLNGLFSGVETGEFTLTNEMSNILSSRFKEGFKVINATNDPFSNTVYFFLTNPTTGVGEFGQIRNIQQLQDLEDPALECASCPQINELATPLEDIEQIELNTYETLLSDSCLDPQDGFNFSVLHPIKKTVIKNEKCGKTIYFADNYNSDRYINLDNLSQYTVKGSFVCNEDNTEATCLDTDKLLIFRKYNLPKITPVDIQLGGRLKKGVYEFLLAYADPQGNEISEYVSITNPIRIFENTNQDTTNFSIRLEVSDLDQRYTHYKVVVIQNTLDSVGATRFFEEGLHTINDNTVVYGGEQNKKAIELVDILRENLFVKHSEFLTEANNSLILGGVTLEKEINLQPVVNLLGSFLKWQTHIAKENIYEDGVDTSLYLGYNRDEVVPFSLRFLLEGGFKTAVFPLIARAATTQERQMIDTLDKDSIDANLTDCNSSGRTERWQFYNTATEEGFCDGDSVPTVEVQENITKICTIESIETLPAGNFTVELLENYINLEEYIEDNRENCPDAFGTSGICDLLDITNYTSETCLTTVVEQIAGSFVIGKEYTITFVGTTDFTLIGASSNTLGAIFISTGVGIGTGKATYESSLFGDNCDTAELLSDVIEVQEIVGETFEGVEKVFPEDYSKIRKPEFCNLYQTNTDGTAGFARDKEFEILYMYKNTDFPDIQNYYRAYKRNYNFINEECSYAQEIQNLNSTADFVQGYFHNYLGALTIAELQTTKNAINTPTAPFTAKIHKNALWFKAIRNNRAKFLLEVSAQNDPTGDDDVTMSGFNSAQELRLSIFNKCSDSTALFSQVISITTGKQYLIYDITPTSFKIDDGTTITTVTTTVELKDFFVVIDVPMYPCQGKDTYTGEDDDGQGGTILNKYRLAPTDGCFGVATRNIEFTEALISWDSITVRKKSTYRSLCTFNQPVVQNCKATPYNFGKFAYWESQETYPDNPELFNSTTLEITPSQIPLSIREEFEKSFVVGTLVGEVFTPTLNLDGSYEFTEEANFSCKNIRHYKFPDNKVSPFMYDNPQSPFSDTVVFPLGVTIDETLINSFLDIAVANGLITQEYRDKITSYEVFRGDIAQDRSIVASGLLYDMRKYKETDQAENDILRDRLYSSYPFNDLGNDILNYDSKDRDTFIPHPHDGLGNTNFTFHSPETDYYRPTAPSELSIQGYMFGQSRGFFNEVEDHSKWVILSPQAKNLATTLAILEVATETAVLAAQALSNGNAQTIVFFTGTGGGAAVTIPYSPIAAATILAVRVIEGALANVGRYRYEWLKVFRDLGQPQNFSSYYVAEGFYNYFQPLQSEDNQLRGINIASYIKTGQPHITNQVTGERILINNINRENSLFISLGENYLLSYPDDYKNYDNNTVDSQSSSLTIASQNNACVSGRSQEIRRNIASPYAAIKNFLPNQYGTLNSIKWLSTGYRGYLNNPQTSCTGIFGGDTFIARHTLKRKMPMFLTTAFGLANLTPFNYKFYSNIGKFTRFYADYEVLTDYRQGSALFPDIDYELRFDCSTRSGNYYKKPSKFYLWYYGIPSFLTETRINTNFRTNEETPNKNFYPNIGDIVDWTQEKNVSIKEPNYFFYNDIYSKTITTVATRTLKDTFNQEASDCRNDFPNGIIWSLQDNSENNESDPWLTFKPLNFFEFPTSYGKLRDLRTIEREQILARFEQTTALFDAIDTIVDDGQTPQTRNLLTSFARRPVTFSETTLGYGGTQSSQSVSCEFGHFHVDAKRGQVMWIPSGGKGMEEISSFIGGKPSGMSTWFKEQLPFKILKYFPDVGVDNPWNGVGITMGWDSRFKRVLITKKDYIPIKECITYTEGVGFTYTEDCENSGGGDCQEADIIMILDNSGSITPDEAVLVHNFGKDIVDGLEQEITADDVRIGIVKFSSGITVSQELSTDITTIKTAIDEPGGGGVTNITIAMCEAQSLLYGTNSRPGASKKIILVIDGTQSAFIANPCAIPNTDQGLLDYADSIKTTGTHITLVATGTPSEITNILNVYGGTDLTPPPNYPLSSAGGGLNGFATYEATFEDLGTTEIVEDIINEVACSNSVAIDLNNEEYFKEVSWTIAFSPVEQKWIGWYSYKPNYYIDHQNYFQAGWNTEDHRNGIWSHLLTNKSYQVFCGVLEPFIIDYQLKRDFKSQHIHSIKVQLDVERYHNDFDVAAIDGKFFNKMWIYSKMVNSGELRLEHNTGQINLISKYPITAPDKTYQEILVSKYNNEYSVNTFYNRVLKSNTNTPQWFWDEVQVNQTLNTDLVKFGGKTTLEPIRDKILNIRLQQDRYSQFKYNFHLASSKINLE